MGRIVSISFLILNAVAAVLPAFVLEPAARKMGRVKTHWISLMFMAAGYGGILLYGTSPTMIYIMMALCGIGWAAIVSLPFAIMSQKVDQSKMGLYMGVFNLSVVLPQLVASLGVGEAISASPDKSLIFLICAGCLLASGLSWMMVKD
jgi:MFS family permease